MVVEENRLSFESPYVRRCRRACPRHRLVCLPHAGAGATSYAEWPGLLPPDVELVVVQLPGREDRLGEPAFTDVPALLRTAAQVLRPYLRPPFSVFGHSGGALFAYELARALAARSAHQPAHLFLSGQAAPDRTGEVPALHALPDDEFVEAVTAIGGTTPAVLADPQLREVVLPALRADFTLWERYRFVPGPALAMPFTVFGGDRDERAPLATLRGWAAHTNGEFDLQVLDGAHFYLQERRAEVAGVIAAKLAGAQVAPEPVAPGAGSAGA